MSRLALSTLAAVAAITLAAAPAAAVPTEVSFAGRLADADGVPVDGPVDLEFRLYDGATMVWEETHAADAEGGLVFVALGSNEPLDSSVFTGDDLELEIVIDGEPSSPRLPILSVPYAGRSGVADDAERLGGQPASAFATASHHHDGDYIPLGGVLSCEGTQKVTGISAGGDVLCAADQGGTSYTADGSGGLALNGTAFSIAANGVNSARIANGSVTADDLAADSVGNTEIAQGAVGADEIAPNQVGSSEIATGAVGADEIAADAVTADKILTGAVGPDAILDDSIWAGDIGQDAIRSYHIKTDHVGFTEIAGTEVPIYTHNVACDPSIASQLTLSNVPCTPRLCSGPSNYAVCGQSCGSPTTTNPQACNPILRGYLLAP